MGVRLIGSLDVEALGRSLDEVMRRHEALRTTFPVVAGRPVQVMADAQSVALVEEDLSLLGEEEREAELRRLAAEEAKRPFDLAVGPLVRARLWRLGEEEHALLLTMHHIVSDGWSLGILTRELAALYGAFRAGCPSPLPDLSIQYADFASWQRDWLTGWKCSWRMRSA